MPPVRRLPLSSTNNVGILSIYTIIKPTFGQAERELRQDGLQISFGQDPDGVFLRIVDVLVYELRYRPDFMHYKLVKREIRGSKESDPNPLEPSEVTKQSVEADVHNFLLNTLDL